MSASVEEAPPLFLEAAAGFFSTSKLGCSSSKMLTSSLLLLVTLPFLARRQDTIQDSFQFGRSLGRERGRQVRTVEEVSAVLEGLGEHVKTTLDNPISTHINCDLCAPLLVILPLLFIIAYMLEFIAG